MIFTMWLLCLVANTRAMSSGVGRQIQSFVHEQTNTLYTTLVFDTEVDPRLAEICECDDVIWCHLDSTTDVVVQRCWNAYNAAPMSYRSTPRLLWRDQVHEALHEPEKMWSLRVWNKHTTPHQPHNKSIVWPGLWLSANGWGIETGVWWDTEKALLHCPPSARYLPVSTEYDTGFVLTHMNHSVAMRCACSMSLNGRAVRIWQNKYTNFEPRNWPEVSRPVLWNEITLAQLEDASVVELCHTPVVDLLGGLMLPNGLLIHSERCKESLKRCGVVFTHHHPNTDVIDITDLSNPVTTDIVFKTSDGVVEIELLQVTGTPPVCETCFTTPKRGSGVIRWNQRTVCSRGVVNYCAMFHLTTTSKYTSKLVIVEPVTLVSKNYTVMDLRGTSLKEQAAFMAEKMRNFRFGTHTRNKDLITTIPTTKQPPHLDRVLLDFIVPGWQSDHNLNDWLLVEQHCELTQTTKKRLETYVLGAYLYSLRYPGQIYHRAHELNIRVGATEACVAVLLQNGVSKLTGLPRGVFWTIEHLHTPLMCSSNDDGVLSRWVVVDTQTDRNLISITRVLTDSGVTGARCWLSNTKSHRWVVDELDTDVLLHKQILDLAPFDIVITNADSDKERNTGNMGTNTIVPLVLLTFSLCGGCIATVYWKKNIRNNQYKYIKTSTRIWSTHTLATVRDMILYQANDEDDLP